MSNEIFFQMFSAFYQIKHESSLGGGHFSKHFLKIKKKHGHLEFIPICVNGFELLF
jgi:hypothetical protein